MFENAWNTWIIVSPAVTAYLVGNCGGAGLPSYWRREVDGVGAHAQASLASPSMTGEVDRGTVLDGGVARACGAAREGAGCGAATLEKAVAGSLGNGEGKRHYFFRSYEALKRTKWSCGRTTQITWPTCTCHCPKDLWLLHLRAK
jgi:hypothetical protein